MAGSGATGRYGSLSGKIVAWIYLALALWGIGTLLDDVSSGGRASWVFLRLAIAGLMLVGGIGYLADRDWGWFVLVVLTCLVLTRLVMLEIQDQAGDGSIGVFVFDCVLLLGLILPPIARRNRPQRESSTDVVPRTPAQPQPTAASPPVMPPPPFAQGQTAKPVQAAQVSAPPTTARRAGAHEARRPIMGPVIALGVALVVLGGVAVYAFSTRDPQVVTDPQPPVNPPVDPPSDPSPPPPDPVKLDKQAISKYSDAMTRWNTDAGTWIIALGHLERGDITPTAFLSIAGGSEARLAVTLSRFRVITGQARTQRVHSVMADMTTTKALMLRGVSLVDQGLRNQSSSTLQRGLAFMREARHSATRIFKQRLLPLIRQTIGTT